MEDYDQLKAAINELEESIVWVKTLAEVAQVTQEASQILKEVTLDCKKLAMKSKEMLSEIKDIRENEEKLVNNSISAISQSKGQLEKAKSSMIDAHVELRQQIMNDLSGMRQSLSTYHQDQLDRIMEETQKLGKSNKADCRTISEEIKNHTDEISNSTNLANSKLDEISEKFSQHIMQQKRSRITSLALLLVYITILFIVLYLQNN